MWTNIVAGFRGQPLRRVTDTPPKVTALAPEKFVPVMVTEVPPAVLPLLVPRPVTTGAATAR